MAAKRFERIEFHVHGHLLRRHLFNFIAAIPPDGVMLFRRERNLALRRPGKVHHTEVGVLSLNWMDIHEDRRREHLHIRQFWKRFLQEDLDLETAFFKSLAVNGGDRVLSGINMPANGEPLLQAAVMDEKNTVFLDDENGDGEVEIEIEMRHQEKRPAKSGPRKELWIVYASNAIKSGYGLAAAGFAPAGGAVFSAAVVLVESNAVMTSLVTSMLFDAKSTPDCGVLTSMMSA